MPPVSPDSDRVALEKPTLYRLAPDGRSLRLLAARCRPCGSLSYPAGVYGCRRCGADESQLDPAELSGVGILKNFVTIHRDVMPGFPAPAIVGEVEIAPDLVEEVQLLETDESTLARGIAVRAVAVEIERDGRTVIGCRFTADGEQP